MGSKPEFPHALAGVPGCMPAVPGALSCSAEFKGAHTALHSSPGWDTIPRFSGGLLPKGRRAGLAAGPEAPAVTPVPGGAGEQRDNARSRWQD